MRTTLQKILRFCSYFDVENFVILVAGFLSRFDHGYGQTKLFCEKRNSILVCFEVSELIIFRLRCWSMGFITLRLVGETSLRFYISVSHFIFSFRSFFLYFISCFSFFQSFRGRIVQLWIDEHNSNLGQCWIVRLGFSSSRRLLG